MAQENKVTFMESLLLFLAGLPGAINTVLETIGENVPFVGRFLKPTFWTLFTVWLFWGLAGWVGLDALLISAGQGMVEWIPGVSFTSDAVSLIEAAPGAADAVPTAADSALDVPPAS